MTPSNADLYAKLRRAIGSNEINRVNHLCRKELASSPADPDLWLILADIGIRLRRYAAAEVLLQTSAANGADTTEALATLAAARANDPSPREPRYLFIPEWGAGFWSDVAHVLGSLLLAEMTGRIPVVRWGNRSLFSREDHQDAWRLYFEPVSQVASDELVSDTFDYFPDFWGSKRIGDVRRNVLREGRAAGTFGLPLLARNENVVASDTYLGVPQLLPWLEPGDHLHGKSRLQVMRYLVDKYLRLTPALSRSVDTLAAQALNGRRWLAVHIRGTDKIAEAPDLAEVNGQYIPWVDAFLADHPDWGIFLLTDSVPHFAEMMAKYRGRVIATKSIRSRSRGVHYSGHDPVQVANEVISDTYLAARCDAFVGNGTSNVSLAIEFLKDWPEGAYTLLGPDWRGRTMVL